MAAVPVALGCREAADGLQPPHAAVETLKEIARCALRLQNIGRHALWQIVQYAAVGRDAEHEKRGMKPVLVFQRNKGTLEIRIERRGDGVEGVQAKMRIVFPVVQVIRGENVSRRAVPLQAGQALPRPFRCRVLAGRLVFDRAEAMWW